MDKWTIDNRWTPKKNKKKAALVETYSKYLQWLYREVQSGLQIGSKRTYDAPMKMCMLDLQRGPIKQGLNRVCPSFYLSFHLFFCPFVHPSICPGVFLELYHQFFLNFGMLETHMKLWRDRVRFSGKKLLPPKSRKWTKNGPKQGFLNLLENLVIYFY